MTNHNTDFQKYLKSKKVDQSYIKYYQSNFQEDNTLDHPPIDIFSRLLKDRIVLLSGEVDTYNCEFIKANLLYLESLSNDDITMYVNSPGGSVYDGLGLLDIMEYIKPDISTVNTGLAASMGAIILCSGATGKRKALKRSRTMIHQPLGAAFGYQQASDMEIEAREVNELKRELYQIISSRTNQKYDKVSKDGDRNYWMNAKQAKDYGIIDEILIKRK